ncbi:MAG: flagellar biosynthesis protein FlhB [bacterium]
MGLAFAISEVRSQMSEVRGLCLLSSMFQRLTDCPETRNSELVFDLQLFAAEDEGRTEEPTTRKREKAREKGQVAKSMEISQGVITLIAFLVLFLVYPYIFDDLYKFTRQMLSEAHIYQINLDSIHLILIFLIVLLAKILAPIMIAATLTALIANFAQVGLKFTPQALRFDLSRIKPSPQNFIKKVLISKQVGFNLIKSIFKVVTVGYIPYWIIKTNFIHLLSMVDMGTFQAFGLIAKLTFDIVLYTTLLLLFLSIFDYMFQRHEMTESLKMTKQEVKDERKMQEGDPLVKAKIRERQRAAAYRRMMQEVPEADVVITNPTHLAVAIKYEASYMAAPTVVAKGKDEVAERIVEIAKENNIPVVENKPLAQALYESAEIGDEVPPDLYQAVAEVLSYVYKLKNKRP